MIEHPQPEAFVVAILFDVLILHQDAKPLTNVMPEVESNDQINGIGLPTLGVAQIFLRLVMVRKLNRSIRLKLPGLAPHSGFRVTG